MLYSNERNMKSIKVISVALLGMILSVFFAACGDSNSASTDQHEHFEAEGWNLYWDDWQLAYSVYRGKADSSIKEMHVNANCMSEHIHVKFLDDKKKEVEPPTDDEHSLSWEIGDEKILDLHSCGSWGFHLKGVKEGETTLILKVNHHDHADVRTPAIRVVVDKALAEDECPVHDHDDDEDDDHDHELEHED